MLKRPRESDQISHSHHEDEGGGGGGYSYQELENAIIAAIFQIGMNQSSPKSLISLMPETPELTREHIKSHLQKYRIQSEKTNEQFIDFFEKHMRAEFYQFLASNPTQTNSNDPPSNTTTVKSETSSAVANPTEPLLVVATEVVEPQSVFPPLTHQTQITFPLKEFELDNSSIDTTDVSRSVSDDGNGYISGRNAEVNQLLKLKSDFDNAYKEGVAIKNALNEIIGPPSS